MRPRRLTTMCRSRWSRQFSSFSACPAMSCGAGARRAPTWQTAELEPWLDAKYRFSVHAAPVICPAHLATIDMPAVMAAIRCPVVVLHGETWLGSLPTTAELDTLRSLVPDVEIIAIRGAGHDVRRDQPDNYPHALRAVLVGLMSN